MSKILIVVDMQNDFVYGSLGSEAAQAIVPKVVEKVKNWNEKILFTQDTHFEDYFKTLEGEKLPVEHCIKNTEGWEIIDELRQYITNFYQVVLKRTFGYEGWDALFLSKDDEIEIVGLCTDICVVSNALALRMFYPNTKITVDASCCAGTSAEAHNAALQVMKSCQIDIVGE